MVDMFTIYATEVSATEQIKDTKSIIDSFNIIVDTLQNFWYVIALLITAVIFISSFSCVRKRSIKYTKTQLFALKKSGKYIPGIFVELNETKELLRYFLNGKKWKKRLIEKYNFIYKNFYGDILRKANIDDSISFHIKRSEKLYIQVAENLSDEKTFAREVSPLLQIKHAPVLSQMIQLYMMQ